MINNDSGITNKLIADILDDVKTILNLNGDDEQMGDMTESEIFDLINDSF